MTRFASNSLARLFLLAHGALAALTVDVEDTDSIKAAAALVADDLLSYYHGDEPGNPVGVLDASPAGNYAFWTGGLLWGTLLDYRNRTGETKYDDLISQGLIAQSGQNDDYLSPNWTVSIGNDDQSTWALSALLAEEDVFQEPGAGKPQWLTLAKNVFDEQASDVRRAANGTCEGALRWQIFTFNEGYDYINAASNIGYFNLAAQLASLTGNKTYLDAASDTYKLLTDIGLISKDFAVYDGTHVQDCSAINHLQFSYPAALLLEGSAFLYNYTGGDRNWKTRVDGLVNAISTTFFQNGVAFEAACEKAGTCTSDMTFYKGVLHRGLAAAARRAPYTAAKLLPLLRSSAKAAVAQCTGGDNGRTCGFAWSAGRFDGRTGAGAQLSVLAALNSILPVREAVGGAGDGGSGGGSGSGSGSGSGGQGAQNSTSSDKPATGARARASESFGVLVASLVLGGFAFL
ncbi:glycoside hydrolase family 76 protein [Hypoxylon sp. NC1633]|nr:glycoside hydrolase family 76 protein [Hypoxylon sp. NC1633]